MKPRFPDAAFRASRSAQRDLQLPLIEGALPLGLKGHLFVVSTVGTVDSNGAPYPNDNDRPTVINGDGMVWRVDFSPAGADTADTEAAGADAAAHTVVASSRIVVTPDYVLDELTRTGSPLDSVGFVDLGMLRASPLFGVRNFANTAFLPLPGRTPDDPIRLLCGYDAGPPVEIDPLTLETLDVVGQSWDAEALDGQLLFPPVLSTAHPFFDAHTGEFFSVNYGRSGASFLETIPLLSALAFVPEAIQDMMGRVLAALGQTPAGRLAEQAVGRTVYAFSKLAQRWTRTRGGCERCSKSDPERVLPENFLDLVWWAGEGDITRIPVIDKGTGKGAVVRESMHQVAVTRRYVLLLDTNFRLRLDQFYNNLFPYIPEVDRLLRVALATRQGETSHLWVVAREELDRARESCKPVSAFKVSLPGAVHFLADYDDSEGIRILCAHGHALDIAEWVRREDLRVDGTRVRPELHGMIPAGTDLSRLGHYVIDPGAERVARSHQVTDDRLWGIGLYAADGVPAWGKPPERLKRVFWFATGLWDDNYTLFIRSLYAEYPGRQVPVRAVDELVYKGGTPTTLFAVEASTLELVDSYAFEPGVSMSSPQFIPDADGGAGWVAAVVWEEHGSSLWIFAADDLKRGPVTKFAIPEPLGFSLHTAWLPRVTSTGSPRPPRPLPESLMERAERLVPQARRRLETFLEQLRLSGGAW